MIYITKSPTYFLFHSFLHTQTSLLIVHYIYSSTTSSHLSTTNGMRHLERKRNRGSTKNQIGSSVSDRHVGSPLSTTAQPPYTTPYYKLEYLSLGIEVLYHEQDAGHITLTSTNPCLWELGYMSPQTIIISSRWYEKLTLMDWRLWIMMKCSFQIDQLKYTF
jgi:hypothetical protein